MSMDSPVYLNEGFGNLLELLASLRVIGLSRHKISHQMTLISGLHVPVIKPHWIPLPVIDTAMYFLEVVPVKRR